MRRRSTEQWLAAYAATHRHPANKLIHTFCVPAILFAVLGAAYELQITGQPIWLNGATILALPLLIFYASLGLTPFLLMFATIAVMITGIFFLAAALQPFLPALYFHIAIFVVAWIGQFIGHYIEGAKPSFFEDLQFLLVGPLWVFFKNRS